MGRPKGAKNRPKDTNADLGGVHPPRHLDRIAEPGDGIELLLGKYERGAGLLGLSMAEVDRALGDPAGLMERRLRSTSSGEPLPPSAVALYQRVIPLSEGYLRASSHDAMPDEDILDIGGSAASGPVPDGALKSLLTTLESHGITGESEIARTIEFVVMLGYFRMDPQEIFDAVLERKNRQAVEAFDRARRQAKIGKEI